MEEETEGDPHQVAETNARRKAAAVAGELVLGADTVVTIDGEILGKPRDAEEAAGFLRRLAGRTHHVVGGIALADRGEIIASATDATAVTFRALDEAAIAAYVAAGEWQGRAGGYAIQGRGAALVARIEGDYLNVVGLPLARLLDLAEGPFAALFGRQGLR